MTAVLAEPRIAEFVQLNDQLPTTVEVALRLRVEFLGSLFEGLIECLRREFAFLKERGPLQILVLGLLGLFGSDSS